MSFPPSIVTAGLAGAALALLAPVAGHATLLTFDQIRLSSGLVVPTISGNAVPDGYGDRVTGPAVDVPGGVFTYGDGGEGYTPSIVADFYSGAASPTGAGVSLWQAGYGDLVNVLYGNNNSEFMAVRLTADAGYRVGLFGFDLAGWPSMDYVIDAVRVFDGTTLLFEQTDVLVQGDLDGVRHSAFAFGLPLFAADLLIHIDYGNLPGGQHDSIGIDNIRFGQDPRFTEPPATVPEPGALALLGMALLGGRLGSRRKAARSVR